MRTLTVYIDKLKGIALLSWFITIVLVTMGFYFIKKGISFLLRKMHEFLIQGNALGYDN
jgi:hypothetical protein